MAIGIDRVLGLQHVGERHLEHQRVVGLLGPRLGAYAVSREQRLDLGSLRRVVERQVPPPHRDRTV